MRGARAYAALSAVLCAGSGCKSAATSVEVIVETDADPTRRFELRACAVRSGAAVDRTQCTTSWTHGGMGVGRSFFASFGVRPARDWNGADSTDVVLEARVEATRDAPAVAFSRRLRFRFLRGTTATQRVFLPVRCGAPSDSCTTMPAGACTVALACEERGLTCGDDAQCVEPTVEPIERDAGPDVLPPPRDVATSEPDAAIDADAVAMDAAEDDGAAAADASDAGALDAGEGGASAIRRPVLLAPRAGEVVASRRPTLRWSYESGPPMFVRVCADRACATPIASAFGAVNAWTVTVDLPPRRRLYWQVAPYRGTLVDTLRESAMRALWSSGGPAGEPPVLDFDDDGAADWVASSELRGMLPGSNLSYATAYSARLRGIEAIADGTTSAFSITRYGEAMTVGDFDGDGLPDHAVGGSQNSGLVRIATAGAAPDSYSLVADAGATTGLGRALAAAGDVDADGLEDLIIGATQRVVIAMGHARDQTPSHPPVIIDPPANALGFGASVAGCDVDGDGVLEAIVGAPDTTTIVANGGRVFVYPLSLRAAEPVQTIDGATVNGRFGAAMGCGDFNGDGRADLVVGAPGAGGGQGEFLVYTATALGTLRFLFRVSATAAESLGSSIAAGRDLDGDGYADFVVSSPRATVSSMALVGSVGVHFGDPMLSASNHRSATLNGVLENEVFGTSVALTGDANGDGLGDLVVGGPGYAMPMVSAGRLSFYEGRTSWISVSRPTMQRAGTRASELLGRTLAR